MSQATRMIKHSSIYAVGNLSRQLVGFVMLPVYTRYLTPADYGIVGLLIFLVTLIELIFGARMFHAVPKFYYEQDSLGKSHSVISTALIITSAISCLTVLTVIVIRAPISAAMFGTTEHGLLVGIFSVLILTQALENYTLGYVRIQQKPWLFIGASSAKLAMQLTLNILLVVVWELGVLGVAISNVVASVIFASAMTFYTLWNTGIAISKVMARRLLIFSWPLWLSGLAGLYIGSANRYYIRVFSSLDEVGLFELAVKFGSIITLLVWMPFSQYWQTERFNVYQQSNPIPIYQAVFRLITILLILVALGVAIFGGSVIRVMAAPEFHSATQAVPYLVFAAVFQCLTFFSNFSFLVKEKTGWMTWNSYITAGIVTILYLALIPRLGFVGAAQALMLANGIQFLIVHFAAKKQYDMQLSLKPLILYLCVSFAAISLTLIVQQERLVWDIGIKSAIYFFSCVLIIVFLLMNPNVRERVIDFLHKRASSKNPS